MPWFTGQQHSSAKQDRRLLCLEFPGLKTGFLLLRPAGIQADGEVGLGLDMSGELGSERAEVPD